MPSKPTKAYKQTKQKDKNKEKKTPWLLRNIKVHNFVGGSFVFTLQFKASFFVVVVPIGKQSSESSREAKTIFKFLGGHPKQWSGKTKFYRLASDSRYPFTWQPMPTSAPRLCVAVALSSPGCEIKRWPCLESKILWVRRNMHVGRSEWCGDSPGCFSIHKFHWEGKTDDKQSPPETPHLTMLCSPGDKHPE